MHPRGYQRKKIQAATIKLYRFTLVEPTPSNKEWHLVRTLPFIVMLQTPTTLIGCKI